MWANDPNGLLHHQGVWHLYYQHHPHSLQWGPMHWGHASSTDLLHWQHHPVALKPDALGMAFSGSAVVDAANTGGFGPPGSAPWVAMFTHHGSSGEHQSLAHSLDGGHTWAPHAGNPVLLNPGIKDFRDPKLAPCAEAGGWRMVLAAQDHVRLYTSPNLRQWQEASRFGPLPGLAGLGGSVWECPDLFALPTPEGDAQRWVLVVSLTAGGPNGGSATGYWLGRMQGQQFLPEQPGLRWLDHGPDHYAGVTWQGCGTRRVMLAWMSNWAYASHLPTAPWRGAMTQPRELALARVAGTLHLVQRPAAELLAGPWQVAGPAGPGGAPFWLQAQPADAQDWCITLDNDAGEHLHAGYDAAQALFYIDRRQAGDSRWAPGFAQRAVAPRVAGSGAPGPVQLWVDRSSVELLADGGLATLTALCFPRQPWQRLRLQGALASVQLKRYEGAA